MAAKAVESIMSKARELLANGNTKTVFKYGAIVFAAGIVWARLSSVENQVSALTLQVNTQISALTDQINILVTHLLRGP
jgi:hypothetical protein